MALREEATPLVGQVGGLAVHKRPCLALPPEYVLKPLTVDDRGIREVAFYEALEAIIANSRSKHAYSHFLAGNVAKKNALLRTGEMMDTVALALAIMMKDPNVVQSEEDLSKAWKAVKREVDAIHKLSRFVPRYHGVVGQRGVSASPEHPFGVSEDAYLLIQSLTSTFAKPCVIDLKMGTETFEPTASDEKKARESSKYPSQAEFGFRIVGMRFYDPSHVDANSEGFRLFDKNFGRSLRTRDQLLAALRIFFGAGLPGPGDSVKSTHIDMYSSTVRRRVLSNALVDLRPIRRWFDENNSLDFRASSLLIIYEGDPGRGNGDVTMTKMIDFSHVRRVADGDKGYVHGLSTLSHLFTELIEEASKEMNGLSNTSNTSVS